MANQTIGVNLKFSADVSAAKRAMQELQGSLARLYKVENTSTTPGVRFSKDLSDASQAAAQLRIQLQNAFNQDTGKLDLTKFNQEMQKSGMSLEKYKTELSKIGPEGQRAFAQLTHNLATADSQTIQLSENIRRLGTTFMNTLRYQISASALTAFTSAIGESIRYVKDLNQSLTDIRIVTNYGAEEMERYATAATKAAKTLSTTTNEYAKASLIYFQQGLSDEEVQKRTDLTIKMANVTGQAVSEVSDQLTSVWNNFDNGTKSLEHYVDVMVALGAATASSSEEISEGLNKFAAVAETVGLSYEYAAAALATVTATTRQSADIVGTAFKTLFARIQDLELGETLDDGTTLGQYSQALAAIGINIKDINGEVKDMNIILDEMGAKWNTLNKDTQIALAQNVAGVRQYTQLMALMDNWDFFKQNLETANASTGALQNQADIYAESWEAASERVTASLESIYNKLLDDDFFIEATNLLADFIGLVENLIDGLGGMPGLLSIIGVAMTKVFSVQMATGINNIATNIRSLTPTGRKANAELQEKASQESKTSFGTTGAGGQQSVLSNKQSDLQIQFLKNRDKMTESNRQSAEVRLNELKSQKELITIQLEKNKAAERQLSAEKNINIELTKQENLKKKSGWDKEAIDAAANNPYLKGASTFDARNNTQYYNITEDNYKKAVSDLERSSAARNINETALAFTNEETFSALTNKADTSSIDAKIKAIEELLSRLKNLGITADKVESQMEDVVGPELSEKYQRFAKDVEKIKEKIANLDPDDQKYQKKLNGLIITLQQAEDKLESETNAMQENSREALRVSGSTQKFTDKLETNGAMTGQAQGDLMRYGQAVEGLGNSLNHSKLKVLDFGEAITQTAGLISSITMVISSLVGLFKTLSDPEIDPSEKITTILTTVGFMLPTILSTINSLNGSLGLTALASLAAAGGQKNLGDKTKITSFKMLEQTAIAKGLGITLGKLAIYAAAIMIVVSAVAVLAKTADNARNSTANFAASATQGAKDAAEAYSKATTAFNELKQSIESYENALTGLQKLTQGTNEYKQALFDANEQALALIQSHAGLKYYIDSNGLIVFEEGELDRIQAEAQEKKASAYSAKLGADRASREAAIENQKVQLGRKLEGRDFEWNDEDSAATLTGSAIGAGVGGVAGGAMLGGAIGTLIGGPIGTAVGGALGVLAGAIVGGVAGGKIGAGLSSLDNDATSQEQKAMDAIYEAYKEQGDAALSGKGLRDALADAGIHDEALISSLEANEKQTKELMLAMEGNTAAVEAETLSIATQQAHALDQNLQYRDSEAQTAITKALARARTNAEANLQSNIENYRTKEAWGAWYNATQKGKDAALAWANEQGLSQFKTTNFSDNYIEYEYFDEEAGDYVKKKLQYSQLAAWEQAKDIDQAAKDAYTGISKAISTAQQLANGEGLLSIIGGQNLISLSEKELEDFKKSFDEGDYKAYIKQNFETLGYESEEAFTKAIAEGIANWDYETAFGQFSKQLSAEIDSILSAGAEETEYTTGALESYTDALAENNEALHDNTNAWKNLEKKKLAAQAAVANAKFVKGVDALNEVLSDTLDTLLQWNEASLDTYEAADKVQTALEDVFGVRVSAEFIKNNLSEIQALAQGSTENLEELSRAAAVDFALNIDTLSEETKGNFVAMINQLADIAADKTITVGTDINNEEYISSLNEMLANGEITAEQIQQAFGAVGYAPDIKYRTDKQKSTTTHYIYDNGDTNSQPRVVIQETETDIQVPYIAGESTYAEASGIKGSQENGSGITKVRDIGSIEASLGDTQKEKANKLKELDRYHEINEQLSDIERHLDKISKAKDRAFGKAKLDLFDQEIKKQEELIAAEKEYQRQLQENYNNDFKNLDSRFQLDENGRIKNYTDVLTDLINSGIYEGTETYDKIKASADQYEETLNELEAQQEVVNDEILKMKDLSLEKIEYEVEMNIHFDDREIKRLEHLLKNLDDPIDDAAKAIAAIGRVTTRSMNSIDTYIEGIHKILGEEFTDEQTNAFKNLLENMPESEEDLSTALKNILGDTNLTNNQISALEGYIDSLWEASDTLDEFYDNIMEKVGGALDSINEKSERAINRNEQLGKTLQTYQNIVDLVGKKALGVTDEQIRALGRAQVAQAKANLELKQGQLELNKTALAQAETQRDAAEAIGDTAAVEHWNEQIESIKDNIWQLEDEVESAWAETLQVIADDFANAVKTSTSAFEEAMTGIYGSYDNMQAVYNQQKEISERYVEDYQKVYDLSKLNRDLNKSINDTDSIKGKQALRDLQEEINELQESDTKMSQHDLDYLRKKYELRVAEIALEEAQNAKSQVRMRRDSEGNWSYVYTADEDKTAEAQQNFEDKLYEIQELEQNYIDEMQDRVIQAEVDMVEALNNLRAEDFETQEAYQAEVTRITEYYTGLRNYALGEMNNAINNSKEVYNNDWLAYSDYSNKRLTADGGWRTQFSETFVAQINGYTSVSQARDDFESKTITMYTNLSKAFEDWEGDVKDTFELVDEDFDNFGGENGTLNQKVKSITDKLDEVNQKFKDWGPTATEGFQSITDAAAEEFNAFKGEIDKYQQQITDVTNALTRMLELAGVEIPAPEVETETEGTEGNTQGGSTTSTTPSPTESEAKSYYGTYEYLGQKMRTEKAYSTQEEAKKAAELELYKYIRQQTQNAQYNQAIGNFEEVNEQILNYDISDFQKAFTAAKGTIGTENQSTTRLQSLDEKDRGVFSVMDISGKTHYLLKDSIKSIKQVNVGDKDYYAITTEYGQLVVDESNMEKISQNSGVQSKSKTISYNGIEAIGYSFNGSQMEAAVALNHTDKDWFEKQPIGRTMTVGGILYYEHPKHKEIWMNSKDIVFSYDTGGYTGSWDSSGRLAMLHQKELVLNAADTENFLAAVNIVRDIASMIDLQALAYQGALNQMTAASVAPTTQTLQQEVTIHAEFPNATQRTEIEAAFDTLLNRASQFANRKK